jgi:hypothetical protein
MSPDVHGELWAVGVSDEMAGKVAYQSDVGTFLHMAQYVHPDIALPQGALATYCSAPTDVHFAAMLDVVCCMGSTEAAA